MVVTDKKTIAEAAKPAQKKVAAKPAKRKGVGAPRFVKGFFGYFAGAWREIRQVRWPSRKATWSSTLAVLLFTAFWMVVVLLCDLLFQTVLNNVLS